MLFKNILFAFSFACLPLHSYTQGCSDAGFCTMGAMKPDQHLKTRALPKLLSMEVSQYVARTKFEDYVCATTIEANFGLGKSNKNTLQVKLPYMMVFNYLQNTRGLGDISLSYTRALYQKEHLQISGTLGAKIPTNHANKTTDTGLPLPMYHQTSLGTYDAVAGLSILFKGWLFATGYQQPLLNENYNQFTWVAWNTSPLPSEALKTHQNKIPMSKLLKRRTDAMLRVERNLRFQRMDWHIGLLGIYRFKKDEFINGKGLPELREGSDGLALSLIVGFTHHLSAKSALRVVYGDALRQRSANPDGLSREQVYTVGYQYSF